MQFILFVDISVMAHWQIPMVVEFLQLQYIDRVVDVPVVQLHRCCSWRDGMFFCAVYTGTRPGVPPPSGRGRGGGDAGSLLPGVLPPN